MKKSSLTKKMVSYFCMGGVFICMILTACENFLEGSQVKKDLEAQIDYASMQKYDVEVSLINSDHGELFCTGNTNLTVGDSFQIEFRLNSNFYTFSDRFRVTDKKTGELLDDAIEFLLLEKNELTSVTSYFYKATLKTSSSSLRITPECSSNNDVREPQIWDFHVARTKEDLENGNYLESERWYEFYGDNPDAAEAGYKNHVNGKVWISLTIEEEDSGIQFIEICEQKISASLEYADKRYFEQNLVSKYLYPNNYEWLTFGPFEYEIHEDDGAVHLALRATDGAGNTSESGGWEAVTVLKDTVCHDNFYLHNNDFIYNLEYGTEEDAKACSQQNADGSVDMDFYFKAGNDNYLENAWDSCKDIIWKYAVSQDLNSIDKLILNDYSSEFDALDGSGYPSKIPLRIHIADPSKSTYVKFYKEDTVGNSCVKYFYIPSAPDVFDARIVTENYIKILKVTAGPGHINCTEESYDLSYCLFSNLRWSTSQQKWKMTETTSQQISVLQARSDYGDSYYDSTDNTDFCLCTKFYIKEDELFIAGPLSAVQNARLNNESSTADITFTQDMVTFTDGGEENVQTVTVSLNSDEIPSFKKTYIRYPQKKTGAAKVEYEDVYASFTGNTVNFTIASEEVFKNGINLELLAIPKTGVPVSKTLAFSPDYTGFIDNIKPTYSSKMHYPHGWMRCTINDIGYGFKTGDLDSYIHYQTDIVQNMGGGTTFSNKNDGSLELTGNFSVNDYLYMAPCYLIYDIKDKEGNATYVKENFTLEKIIESIAFGNESYSLTNSGSTSKFIIKFPSETGYSVDDYPVSYDFITDEILTEMYINLYKWKAGNHWLTPAKNGKEMTVTIPFSDDGFLRIFAAGKGPYYFWSKGIQKTTITDLIEGQKGVQIYSDKPFFIHTIWSQINWNKNEGNWANDIYKWESTAILGTQEHNNNATIEGSTEVKPECITGNHSVTPYYYTIPDPMDEINYSDSVHGTYYYTTIVHFADGTSLMSSVRSKTK